MEHRGCNKSRELTMDQPPLTAGCAEGVVTGALASESAPAPATLIAATWTEFVCKPRRDEHAEGCRRAKLTENT